MADYLDPRTGDVMKFLSMVPPAAPMRAMDGGTITQGLTLAPTGTNNVGTFIFDLPRWHLVYKSIYLRVRGSVASTSAVGGTVQTAWAQYDGLMQNLQLSQNGGDFFQTWGGGDLNAFNRFQGQYRNGEQVGPDQLISVAPSVAGGSKSFDMSWVIPFHEYCLYPRLFGLFNAYENHGVTSFQMRGDLGNVNSFVTGDAGATLTITDVQVSFNVLDFGDLIGYGEPYVRETAFPRLETRVLRSLTLANATQQRTKLDRGLYYRMLMLFDLSASGVPLTPAPNNITKILVQRDQYDPFVNNYQRVHLQRMVADRTSNCFATANSENHVYLVDFAPEMEITQLINTQNMTDWDVLVDSGAAGSYRILEVLYNIPIARIKKKDPTMTMAVKGSRY